MKVRCIASVPRDIGLRLHWECQRKVLIPMNLEPEEYGGAFWHQSLENLIESAIDQGYDYALTLDYDAIFERRHVEEMLRLAADYPQADVICPWMIKRDSTDRIFGVRYENGIFRKHFDVEEFDADLMPIHTGHFGLTMIRLAALEAVNRPLIWAQPDGDGHWRSGKVDADIYFWNKCHEAGLKLYLATKIRIGHLQQVITWPTDEFDITHQYVEDFRRNGAPKNT